MEGVDQFIGQLPPHLQQVVQVNIHKETFTTDPFFMGLSKEILSFLSSRLRPEFFQESQYLY